MTSCIFCKIANKELATNLLYEDEYIAAFNDLHPKAEVHVLVVTKQHIKSLAEIEPKHSKLMGHLLTTLHTIAKEQGLHNGFRTIINTGEGGGQEIGHLHLHILGSKQA